MRKILVAEDNREISDMMKSYLVKAEYEVHQAFDGAEALEKAKIVKPDLALLDIMMPGLSGLELCRMIRNKVDCPIIFVSAKGKTLDAVLGLEIGGDDYISKPFVVEELVARAKAHLRREQRSKDVFEDGVIKVGDIEIHTGSFEVFKNSKPIQFSTREFQLLQYLMENAGKVLTREQIFSHVWDTEFGDIGTVAVNIKSIRDKLDPNNEYIKTVWGVGYKFVKTH